MPARPGKISVSGGGSVIHVPVPDNVYHEISPDFPTVRRNPNDRGGAAAYRVTIPEGVRGGQPFPVIVQGTPSMLLMVECPQNALPGMTVHIVPPPHPVGTDLAGDPNGLHGAGHFQDHRPPRDGKSQLFEVTVPNGAQPGQPFSLIAGGLLVQVTCPSNVSPGQRIRFKLPLAITQKPKTTNETARIKLLYDKDGWQRTLRLSDMKLQWVRVDDKNKVENNTQCNVTKSAYVRKLEFRPGTHPHIRAGILTLVPASEVVVDSRIKSPDNRVNLVTYSDIAAAQVKAFQEKVNFFQDRCALLRVDWNEGHMRMDVRRQTLLGDSIDAVMSQSREDLCKVWRFNFATDSPGIDDGAMTREWFQLVTDKIFDPDMGLWQSSAAGNQMCMEINPASDLSCQDHLVYFRFLGRVMGKALFDSPRQQVAHHMAEYMYKHILGWPIAFSDLEMVDEEFHNRLKSLAAMHQNGEDVGILGLTFTTTKKVMEIQETIELVKDGANMDVTNDNLPEYLEACLKYRMLDRVKPQLNELLLGFFDVIPEPLLTIFDFQELEVLMCGLPEIDMSDWMEHTEYSGEYDGIGVEHQSCKWFWEVVTEFDQEMKVRLLQFVAGISRVPSGGFGVLQGNDGIIRKFTIHGVALGMCLYPRAHTSFHRLDLPMYESRAELEEKLKLAVTTWDLGRVQQPI